MKWRGNTAELVPWNLIGTLYEKKQHSEKQFITKYVNHILPVLGLKSTITPTNMCPCCQNLDLVLRILLRMVFNDLTLMATMKQHEGIDWRECAKITEHQKKLGWTQILYGRLAHSWINQQHRYEQNRKEIWCFAAKQWAFQNKTLTGGIDDNNNSYRIQQEVLLYRIKSLYAKQQDMIHIDCMPFQGTIEEWAE
eukprot:7217129-Ditylum_brightwellii.AAC.1